MEIFGSREPQLDGRRQRSAFSRRTCIVPSCYSEILMSSADRYSTLIGPKKRVGRCPLLTYADLGTDEASGSSRAGRDGRKIRYLDFQILTLS